MVYITGFHDTQHGRKAFKKARTLAPDIQLDPIITTPEIKSAFDASAPGADASAPGADAGEPGADAASSGEVPEIPVVLDDADEAKKKKKHKKHHVEDASDERVVVTCSRDSDCEGGQVCKLGECVVRPPPPTRRRSR